MEKISQKELCSEGFWDGFKKVGRVAGAAATGAGRLVDIALPEVTKPIKGAVSAFRNVSNAVKQAWEVLTPRMELIRKKLESQGFALDESKPPQKTGKNFLIFGNQITGTDQKTGEPTIDEKNSVPFVFDGTEVKRATNSPPVKDPAQAAQQKGTGATPTASTPSTPTAPSKPASAAPVSSGTPARQPRPIGSPTQRRTS